MLPGFKDGSEVSTVSTPVRNIPSFECFSVQILSLFHHARPDLAKFIMAFMGILMNV